MCGCCSVALLAFVIGAAITGGAMSGFSLLAKRVEIALPANCSMSRAEGTLSAKPDYCGDANKCKSWEKTEDLHQRIHQGGNEEIGEPFDCELKSLAEGTYSYSCLCEAESEYRSTDETDYNPPLEFSFTPTSLPDARITESMLKDCAFTRIREYTMDTGVNQSGIDCFYVPAGVHEAEEDGKKVRYELPPIFVLGWEQDEALEHLRQVYDTIEGVLIGLVCGVILTLLCSCCFGISGCVFMKQQPQSAEQSPGYGQQPTTNGQQPVYMQNLYNAQQAQVVGQSGQQPSGMGHPCATTAYGSVQQPYAAYGSVVQPPEVQATVVQQPAGYGQPGSGF
jgi:hypothetical protein